MKSKTIDFLFLAAFLFIGITLFTTYSSFRKLDTFNELVDHSYVVKNKIKALESEARSMISNQRTYLLAGVPEYLIKYRQQKDHLDTLFSDLEYLVRDNPEQTENLATLRKNFALYSQALNEELNLYSEGTAKTDKEILNNITVTHKYVEQFVLDIEAMDDAENELLHERLDYQWQGKQMTPIAFSVLGLLSFAVIAFAFFRQKSDLSEKEDLLKNKRQLLKRLLNSNAELEEYAYLASHDLQEPLRKIQMFTDTAIMAMDRDQPDNTRRFLQKIDHSSQEAQKMIKGLLNHAQVDRSKDELSLKRLSDLFKDVANEFRIAHKPDVTFNLFQLDETPKLMVFEAQILELFRNLLSNAVKFRKEDSSCVELGLIYSEVTKENEDFHCITISDKGQGFDPSNAELVFEMFSKLSLHKNSKKNSLGLSLCKKIMSVHRGSIVAETIPGQGTSFHLFFPKAY